MALRCAPLGVPPTSPLEGSAHGPPVAQPRGGGEPTAHSSRMGASILFCNLKHLY